MHSVSKQVVKDVRMQLKLPCRTKWDILLQALLTRHLHFLTSEVTVTIDTVDLLQLYRLERYGECCRIYKDLLKNTQVCTSTRCSIKKGTTLFSTITLAFLGRFL